MQDPRACCSPRCLRVQRGVAQERMRTVDDRHMTSRRRRRLYAVDCINLQMILK